MQHIISRRSAALLGCVYLLVAALTVMSANTAAAAATVNLTSSAGDLARAVALLADPPCPPNSSDPLPASERRCVAETVRSTRSGLNGACVVSPKALAPNPWYFMQECRGGPGAQAEAVAQSRAIAWLNRYDSFGDVQVGGISANIQWEPLFNVGTAVAPKYKRADILVYNRSPETPTAPIRLIEVKGTWIGGDQAARVQLAKYVQEYPGGPNNRPVDQYVFSDYSDAFRILVKDCQGTARYRVVQQYIVDSTPSDGVLEIKRFKPQATPCPQNGQLEELPTEEEVPEDIPEDTWDPLDVPPPVSAPRPGTDDDQDGEDDFKEWIYEEHPELADVPGWPDVDVPVVQGDVLVDVATVVAIVAVVGLVAYFGTPLAIAFLANILRTLALTQGTSASLASISGPLAAFVAFFDGGKLWGDPHLATIDGFKYDLQAVGEFHLLEVPTMNIDVQARFVPFKNNSGTVSNRVSVTDRVVTEIDDAQIEFRADGAVLMDGDQLNIPSGGMWPLGEGGAILRNDGNYVLFWPGYDKGLAMVVSGRNVGFVVPPGVQTRGLLGNANGDPLDDLALRDGTALSYTTSANVLHDMFADSWRVTDEDTMFEYGPDESTIDFTDTTFPAQYVTLADFSPAQRAAATQVCVAAGVAPGPQFDACQLDYLVTSDLNVVATSVPVDEALVDSSTSMFNASGVLAENFEASIPSNFASFSYVTDAATSKVAGHFFDQTGYRFFGRDVPRHNSLNLKMDLYAFGPINSDGQPQRVDVIVDDAVAGTVTLDGAQPTLTGDLTGTITQTGTGTADGKSFVKLRLNGSLGHAVDSVNVELKPTNFSVGAGISLAVDNIELQTVAPAAQTFATSVPFVAPGIPGGVLDPANGAGNLETPGASDEYTFSITTAQAGRKLLMNTAECAGPLNIDLINQATGSTISTFNETCGVSATPALSAGNYRVRVTSFGNAVAGTYQLEALMEPDPQTFSYAIGNVVSNGVPASGAGQLETFASVDRYTFSVPTGGTALAYNNISGDKRFSIVNTATGQAAAAGAGDTEVWLSAGSYRLEFGAQDPGTYSFELLPLPNGDDGDSTITTGIDYVDINFGESTNTTSWQTPNSTIKPDSNQPWTGAAIPGTQAGTTQLAAAGTAVTNGSAYFDIAPGTVDYTNPGTAPFKATMRFAVSDRADSDAGEVIFRKGVASTTGGLVTLKMHDNSEGYPECRFSDQANDTSDPTVRANEDLNGSPLSLFSPANDPRFFEVTCWSSSDSLGISVRDETGTLVSANSVPRPSGWLGPNPTAGFRIGGASTTVNNSTCTTCLFDRFTWTVDRTFTLTNVPWANDTGAWAQTANYPFTNINASGKFADTWGTNPMTINGITTVTETVDKVSRTSAKFVAPSVGLLDFANGLVPQDDPFRVAAIVKLTSAGLSDTNGSTIWYHREGVAMKLVPNGTDKQSLSCVWPVTTGANPTYREIVSTQTIGNSTKYFSLECWRYKEPGDPQFVYGYTFDAGADGVGAVSVIADPNTLVDVDAQYTLSVGNAAAADGSIPGGGGAQQFRGNMDRLSIYGNWQ